VTIRDSIDRRADELTISQIAAGYAAVIVLLVTLVVCILQLMDYGQSQLLLPLGVTGAPLLALLTGALVLCHALAVSKLTRRA
jgi:hypothetical protein